MTRHDEYLKCVGLGYFKSFEEWMHENFGGPGPGTTDPEPEDNQPDAPEERHHMNTNHPNGPNPTHRLLDAARAELEAAAATMRDGAALLIEATRCTRRKAAAR